MSNAPTPGRHIRLAGATGGKAGLEGPSLLEGQARDAFDQLVELGCDGNRLWSHLVAVTETRFGEKLDDGRLAQDKRFSIVDLDGLRKDLESAARGLERLWQSRFVPTLMLPKNHRVVANLEDAIESAIKLLSGLRGRKGPRTQFANAERALLLTYVYECTGGWHDQHLAEVLTRLSPADDTWDESRLRRWRQRNKATLEYFLRLRYAVGAPVPQPRPRLR